MQEINLSDAPSADGQLWALGAFEDAPVPMAMISLAEPDERRIIYANNALCDLLGYSRDELLTMSFAQVTHPDDQFASADGAQMMSTGEHPVFAAEKRYLTKGGDEVWVWLHSAVMTGERNGSPSALAHIIDITDKRRAEQQRDRARLRLEGLGEIRSSLLSEMPLQFTLDQVCTRARELVGADVAVMCSLKSDGTATAYLSSGAGSSEASVPSFAVINSAIAAHDAGSPTMIVTEIESAAEGRAVLVVGGQPDQIFDESDIELVGSYAIEATTAIQLGQARNFERKVELLEERERLARDLNSIVVQRLFSSGLDLLSVQHLVQNPIVKERLAETVAQLDQTIHDLRKAIFELSQPAET